MSYNFTAPTLQQYAAGISDFLQESRGWHDLDVYHFYSVCPDRGYYESCDNAYGGLDVSWAFHFRKENRGLPSNEEIATRYADLLLQEYKNFVESLD